MQQELIKHIVKPNEETGLYNAKFAIWLFLASEIMLFGALFSAYILLRVGAPSWPVQSEVLSIPIGAINSVILVTSSMFIIQAWVALKADNFARFKKFMGLTIAFAVIFLCFKSYEYYEHLAHHEYPSKSIFLAIYFLVTALHALHILGGIAANAYLMGPGSKIWFKDKQWFTNRVEVAGLYWHFVDIVWIFVYATLYLL